MSAETPTIRDAHQPDDDGRCRACHYKPWPCKTILYVDLGEQSARLRAYREAGDRLAKVAQALINEEDGGVDEDLDYYWPAGYPDKVRAALRAWHSLTQETETVVTRIDSLLNREVAR
jgi:hypothetical protein